MIYHEYEIDAKYLTPDGKSIVWRITGSGESVSASKNGKRYLIKRNNTVLYPDEEKLRMLFKDPEILRKAVESKTGPFKELRKKQREMMTLMEPLDYKRDHVAKEVEEFRDEQNHFVTVAPFVEGGIFRDSYDFTTLSQASYVQICYEMALTLAKLHGCKVIHSDIKLDNFVITKEGSKYIPYLIDFDMSFPSEKVPLDGAIGGSPGHIPPETLTYRESKAEADRVKIKPELDVFALACTMHYLWTYELPRGLEGEEVGNAVLNGKSFKINPKFDFKIGSRNNVLFSHLLKAMLDKDPAKRPSAALVAKILSDEAALSSIGSGTIEIPIPPKEEKKEEPTPVNPVGTPVCEPWPSDNIALVGMDELNAKGFSKLVRAAREGVYSLTRTGSFAMTYSAKQLLDMGLAKKKGGDAPSASASDDRLWEEDRKAGYFVKDETLAKMHITKLEKIEVGGERKYRLTYAEGKVQELNGKLCKLMGVFKK